MNWLVIDKDFNEESLTPELRKVYEAYKDAVSKRGMFDSIKFLKKKDITRYILECKKLANSMVYITFNKNKLKFQVQPKVNGKRVYIGTFDSFDEACFNLKEYIKLRQL